jgi:hypothetical protein
VQEKDLAMMGMLPSLGIRKGQPFKRDAETAKTLEQAVKVGYKMMQNYSRLRAKRLSPSGPRANGKPRTFPGSRPRRAFRL